MHLTSAVSPAIFNQDAVFKVSRGDIDELKKKSLQTENKVIRICLHSSPESTLHEMLIVHQRNAYVRPHKHLNKPESFHIIDGALDVYLFNDDGKVLERIEMGEYDSGKPFCYRLSAARFHTVVPRSEQVVFHEVTNGPFNRSETVFSPWSPEPGNLAEAQKFLSVLNMWKAL